MRPFLLSLESGQMKNGLHGYLELIANSMHIYNKDDETINKDTPWRIDAHVTTNDIVILYAYKHCIRTIGTIKRKGITQPLEYNDFEPICSNQLYTILTEHPHLYEIPNMVKNTILFVHYWILWDICDKSLVQTDLSLNMSKRPQTNSNTDWLHTYRSYVSDEEPDYPDKLFHYDRRKVAACTLSEEAKCKLRLFLQCIPNLHVVCNDVWPHNWGLQSKAAHVAILKTFPNITDFNYSANDKNGTMYPELSWDLWKRWGIRSHHIVRYHGSDDCCYKGDWSEEARFLQVSQHGNEDTTESVWREWQNHAFRDVLQYMRLQGKEVKITNEFLNDMAYFKGLVTVMAIGDDIDCYVHLSGFNERNEKYLVLADMPNLIQLSMCILAKEDPDTPLDSNQEYCIYIDIQNCPNLKYYPSIYDLPDNVQFIVRNKETGKIIFTDKSQTDVYDHLFCV